MPGVKREGVQNPTVFQGGEEQGRGGWGNWWGWVWVNWQRHPGRFEPLEKAVRLSSVCIRGALFTPGPLLQGSQTRFYLPSVGFCLPVSPKQSWDHLPAWGCWTLLTAASPVWVWVPIRWGPDYMWQQEYRLLHQPCRLGYPNGLFLGGEMHSG